MVTGRKRIILIIAAIIFMATQAYAIRRDEIIGKCKEAGELLKSQGLAAAIKAIENLEGPFVWNQNVNYLFLMDMKGKMLAHPFKPELKKPDQLLDFKDVDGKPFFVEFMKAAELGAGWVTYKWPIPGETKPIPKTTFIYRVPDTDYLVGSGIYVIKAGEYY